MILSDIDIKKYIESGDIAIDSLNESLVRSASYTFSLGDKLFLQKSGEVDAVSGSPEFDEITIPEEGYVLNPGDFILGQTAETLSISNKLCCFLDTRSSLARIGIDMIQTSTFVNPGHAAVKLTLEISNSGPAPVRLHARMRVVKGIFALLSNPSEQNYSDKGRYDKSGSTAPILD